MLRAGRVATLPARGDAPSEADIAGPDMCDVPNASRGVLSAAYAAPPLGSVGVVRWGTGGGASVTIGNAGADGGWSADVRLDIESRVESS